MKIITSLLMIASVSVAQAQVYKCPGKVEGQYTYQERPCKGAKAEEHTIKIVPADEKKIAEAQAKLAREIDAEKNQLISEPLTETKKVETNNASESVEKTSPPTTSESANVGAVNSNQAAANSTPAPASQDTVAIPAVATPKAAVTRPAPVVANPTPKKAVVKPGTTK